jgi:hypothetical protein
MGTLKNPVLKLPDSVAFKIPHMFETSLAVSKIPHLMLN